MADKETQPVEKVVEKTTERTEERAAQPPEVEVPAIAVSPTTSTIKLPE